MGSGNKKKRSSCLWLACSEMAFNCLHTGHHSLLAPKSTVETVPAISGRRQKTLTLIFPTNPCHSLSRFPSLLSLLLSTPPLPSSLCPSLILFPPCLPTVGWVRDLTHRHPNTSLSHSSSSSSLRLALLFVPLSPPPFPQLLIPPVTSYSYVASTATCSASFGKHKEKGNGI